MLALITQSRLGARPWMQLGNAMATLHLFNPALQAPKQPYVGGKRMSSRIPIMIRTSVKAAQKESGTELRRRTEKDEAAPGEYGTEEDAAGDEAVTNVAAAESVEKSLKETNAKGAIKMPAVGSGADLLCGAAVPLVRSTRTSRCRIQLAHPNWSPIMALALFTPTSNSALSSSPVRRRQAAMPQDQMRFDATHRKSLTEPLLVQHTRSGRQLLCFECSDRSLINVPSQLINAYSPLMCERQNEPDFSFSRPIRLDTISSVTLRRLILWMQQHRDEDIKQLQRSLPSLINAGNAERCTWDECFLGFDLDAVLQLLLAANCLGIHALVEQAMLYFIELIEQRNNAERICMQHINQTLSRLHEMDLDQDLAQRQLSPGVDVAVQLADSSAVPQFVATANDCSIELK